MGEYRVELDPTPITIDTFFVGHHHANQRRDGTGELQIVEELAFRTADQIAAVEAGLGIELPAGLRELYLRQNGGSVGGLMAPRVQDPGTAEEDWLAPFTGYDDLYTLEQLRTVFDMVEDYGRYPEDIEFFPVGGEKLVVIAQWYRHTLFLDYRGAGEPRVGFVNFDQYGDLQTEDWDAGTVWWNSFSDFFAQLRRGEYVT